MHSVKVTIPRSQTMRSGACRWLLLIICLKFTKNFCSADQYDIRTGDFCLTPEGIKANCVNISQCEPIQNLLKTLKQPHSPEITKKLSTYRCGDQHQVCCPQSSISLDSEIMDHNWKEAPDVTNHTNFHLLPSECGFLEESLRKTKGKKETLALEHPWMALLRYQTVRGLEFLCGGTIINYNYILTAANCVTNMQRKHIKLVSVRVGEYSLKNDTDCEVKDDPQKGVTLLCSPPVQDLEIEEIIPHPEFLGGGKNVHNDIALLRVSKIMKENNVYPVCLPVGKFRDMRYENALFTGWGRIDGVTKERADILKKVRLPVIEKQNCSAAYKKFDVDLLPTQICAGGIEEQGTCSGDSGGPLLVPAIMDGNSVYVQEGIVSFGPVVCGKGPPDVFTLVKFYMDWILDHMKP